MKLMPLLSGYPILRSIGELPREIYGFTADSNQVKPGYLYICIRGQKTDGHRFAQQAVENGAIAIVSEQLLQPGVPVICVAWTRHFLSFFSDRFYGQPCKKLHITGITGTNGKTTTAHYLYEIYRAAGTQAALMGTVGVKDGKRYTQQSLTTPGPEELHKTLWQLAREGIRHVAMEVSSHALDQKRVEHCRFHAAIFTNLTRDHLDYHKTMDRYFQAKAHLFTLLHDEKCAAVINVDDNRAHLVQQMVKTRTITFGVKNKADIRAAEIRPLIGGGSFVRAFSPAGDLVFAVHMHGLYNVYNALGAAAAALADGISPHHVIAGIESLRHVPGRLELLPSPPGVKLYLDYAHTPDGLEKVLQALEEYPHNRIILVFGCRGQRDRGKRPYMGAIADRYADEIILTADNPADEDPHEICLEIIRDMKKKPAVIVDREQAIHHALSLAEEGDIILIAGKGRENYQLIGKQTFSYSDYESVTSYVET